MSRLAKTAFALVLALGGSARAQTLPQTFVSGVGDDANPCDRTTPCLTFGAALALTDPGGEIGILDPGDFGPITIRKSVSISGIEGRARIHNVIQNVSVDGITIAAGPTDTVVLRGITVSGDGSHTGILFSSGGALTLIDVDVSGFQRGVDFAPTNVGAKLFADGLITHDHAGAGLRVGGGGATGVAVVQRSRSEHNAIGFQAIADGRLSLYDAVASHNSVGGILATLDANGGIADLNVEEGVVSDNAAGVRAEAAGGTGTVRMSKVLMTGNAMATVATGGGAVLSFGNNRVDVAASLALSSSAATQTVTSGGTASFPVNVAVSGLFANPITFACDGLPAGAACTINPSSLPGNVSATLSVTVTTGPSMLGQVMRHGPSLACAILLLFALTGRRRRAAARLLSCLVLGLAFTVAACDDLGDPVSAADMGGGGNPGDLGDLGPSGVVAPGSYPFTVTATSGTVTASVPLTLIVQ